MSDPLLIADSGPLIALARLDLLALPKRYFKEVLVTDAVWLEVTRKPSGLETARLHAAFHGDLLSHAEVSASAPDADPQLLNRKGVDAGERSAILLAMELRATLLMDDRRARLVARELGLDVLGTLALLVRARESGYLGPIRPLLEQLAATGYYLPVEVIAGLLKDLGE